MNHALATYLFEIPPAHDAQLVRVLDDLEWKPRPGSLPPAAAADPSYDDEPGLQRLEDFVHFLSMVVLPRDRDEGDPRAWLLVEVCADGSEDLLAQRLAATMKPEWERVLGALGLPDMDLAATAACLRRHAVRMGTSLWRRPGLAFVGTPGMSVRRIRAETALAAAVRRIMRSGDVPAGPALGKLAHARKAVFEDANLKWALVSEPVPLLAPREPTTALGRFARLALAAFRDYLWVLLPLPLLYVAAEICGRGHDALGAIGRGLLVLGAEGLLLALLAGHAYRRLRQEEDADDPLDREPDPKAMQALMALENFRDVTQNHLSAQSRLKPGWVRYWALRLALWAVAEITKLQSAPGFLNRIGTIHFARWYLLPGTDRLVFLSNYDGSWQSYLEDFIARLRKGLSSLWSNTRDFPRTQNLVEGGAGDGARFKRWARRQQLPTPVWHTAYPGLTTASIRTNAAIRHGLAAANTEAEAVQWLARLGGSVPDALEKDQVPTLVFGGLPRLRFAHALMVRIGDAAGARQWLARHQGEVSYGELDSVDRALVLGFTFTGLKKLGLPDEACRDFPAPFSQGMADPSRARLLGDFDVDPNLGPQPQRWGMGSDTLDMLCLVYAIDLATLNGRFNDLQGSLHAHGLDVVYERPMAELAKLPEDRLDVFGFRDGISQPIVRGTKDWASAKQALHVVNPGEIVLGYPDNLNQVAPTPCADAFDFGRNGTYLVVRHLAQDREAFDDFVKAQADRLDPPKAAVALYEPVDRRTGRNDREEWVAAKMLGRWSDGTPLVRWPEPPPWLQRPGEAKPGERPRAPANDFLLGKEDPEGLRCPFGSHVRRSNPRDSQEPGSKTQLAISNRHRILRVGRNIERRGREQEGMLFMCLNADIERQFEFLQQTWLLGPNFHGLDNETDPIVGAGGQNQALTVPLPNGTVRLEPMSRFVRTMGGGYFFLPGKDCLSKLIERMPQEGI